MVKYYFLLQYRMLNRHLVAFGVSPWVGYILAFIAFIGLSMVCFDRLIFPEYLYPLIGLSFVMKFSHEGRSKFIKTCFDEQSYKSIRLTENVLIVAPFVLFLIYKMEFLIAAGLIVIAATMSFGKTTIEFGKTIPTPFGQYPFEYVRGFRRSFLFIGLCYFLLAMGIKVDNYNLGLFALFVNAAICLSYYGEVEGEFFVWIHRMNPKEFLLHKIKVGISYFALAALPITIVLAIYQPQMIHITLGLFMILALNLINIIVARYAQYPRSMGLPEVIMYIISFLFSPLLILTLPYFYNKSISRLSQSLA